MMITSTNLSLNELMAWNDKWTDDDRLLIQAALNLSEGIMFIPTRNNVIVKNRQEKTVLRIHKGFIAKPGHPRRGDWVFPFSTSLARSN